MIAEKSVLVPTVAEAPPDVLNRIRRLDWRFLLPDPSLGRVVYLGAAESGLLAALQASGVPVTVLAGDGDDHERASFDTAVVARPTPHDLAAAAELLRPGGWLYAELRGSPGAARRIADPLRRLGFAAAQRHWHWPDFERCTRILPLDDVGALTYGLVKGQGGARAVLLRGLIRSGVLPWLARSVSVVAERSAP